MHLKFLFRSKNKQGAILVTTIIILSFLAVLGMSLIVYLLSRTTKATLELDRLKAFYLAEAGIARSVHELKIDKDYVNKHLSKLITRIDLSKFIL